MYVSNPDFAYACRRSREEIVRAINAPSDVVATAHRRLSALHAAVAMAMLERIACDTLMP